MSKYDWGHKMQVEKKRSIWVDGQGVAGLNKRQQQILRTRADGELTNVKYYPST